MLGCRVRAVLVPVVSDMLLGKLEGPRPCESPPPFQGCVPFSPFFHSLFYLPPTRTNAVRTRGHAEWRGKCHNDPRAPMTQVRALFSLFFPSFFLFLTCPTLRRENTTQTLEHMPVRRVADLAWRSWRVESASKKDIAWCARPILRVLHRLRHGRRKGVALPLLHLCR